MISRLTALLLPLLSVCIGESADPKPIWPPHVGQPYPDLQLIDQDGNQTALSSFKNKVLVIEPIGISCAACQAFAGANKKGVGPFGGHSPQPGLNSFEEYLTHYKISKTDDLVYVQLLLYDAALKAPSPAEGKAWAKHFGMERAKNQVVLVGEKQLLGDASFNMIPGFQLVDRDFILRFDSTGHQPTHDLWREFFPALKKMLTP